MPQLVFPSRAGLGRRRGGRPAATPPPRERYFAHHAAGGRRSSAAPARTSSGPAGGCVTPGRPSPTTTRTAACGDSQVPTLLIGGDARPRDAAADRDPRAARRTCRTATRCVLPDLGHTDDFWSYQPGASSHLVNTFLSTAARWTTRATRFQRVDFTPAVSQGRLAELVAGGDPRLHGAGRRVAPAAGPAGAPTRAARAAGQRGDPRRCTRWCSGSAAGSPACSWRWWRCRRSRSTATSWPACPSARPSASASTWPGCTASWPSRTRATGLAAALAGALVGAWLGCNALPGLLAVFTAVVGATAGANLLLIALDVVRAQAARELAARPATPLVAPVRS